MPFALQDGLSLFASKRCLTFEYADGVWVCVEMSVGREVGGDAMEWEGRLDVLVARTTPDVEARLLRVVTTEIDCVSVCVGGVSVSVWMCG